MHADRGGPGRRAVLKALGAMPAAAAALLTAVGTGLAGTAAAQDGNVDTKALYRLGTGDRLRITVFGEEDLSGEFEVDDTGSIALPLVGEVTAAKKTPRELERDVAAALADGYLVSPRVSIEVLNYRPFFILGEVKDPGKYPYVNGMTVLNAVAVAGGYTYRARKDQMVVVRGGENGQEIQAQESTPVLPGDIIRVPERLF